jgi:N-acetylglucosamine malate deacetylase 1
MILNGPVLVVAAHPDDEVLGCGGTIAKLSASGAEVHVLLLAEGATSRHTAGSMPMAREVAELATTAERACKALGAASIRLEGLPDNRLDGVDLLDIVKRLEKVLAQLRPVTVFTHHHGDLNIDHRQVHAATLVACRPHPEQAVRSLFSFEVPSSTEATPATHGNTFLPNWYVDISRTLDRKLAALEIYAAEMRPWPHPRSYQAVEHLARWRGTSSGVAAAEAFQLLRHIPGP